jgi:hypothetical protein
VPTRIDLRQVFEVEPTVHRGHGSLRELFKERKMDQIDMEVQKIEFVLAQSKFMQQGQVSGQVRFQRKLIKPNGLIADRNQRRSCMCVRARE